MSILTRSRALAAKIQSQRPLGSEKTFGDENSYAHPNKRTNLSSSSEIKMRRKSSTKVAGASPVEKKKMTEMSEEEISMTSSSLSSPSEIKMRRKSSTKIAGAASVEKKKMMEMSEVEISLTGANLSSSSEVKVRRKSSIKIASANVSEKTTVSEKKKMEMSEDEMSMNGAPAGDLYDIQVMTDAELFSFDCDSVANSELETACAGSKETLSWADQFSAVEVIRRTAIHHPAVLLASSCLSKAVHAAIEAALSLRSSTIRNGILCMRSLALLEIGSVHICRIVEVLMGRTGSGPKFIALAACKVLDEIVPSIEPLVCIHAVSSSTNIKNTEVSSKAFIIISKAVIRMINADQSVPSSPAKHTSMKEVIRLMSRGLSSRAPLARDASREAFKALKVSLGDTLFTSHLSNSLDGAAIKDVQREVNIESKSIPKKRLPLSSPGRPLTSPDSKTAGTVLGTGVPLTVFTTKLSSRPGSRPGSAGVSRQVSSMRPSIKEMIKSQQLKNQRAPITPIKTDEQNVKRTGSVVSISTGCISPISVIDI